MSEETSEAPQGAAEPARGEAPETPIIVGLGASAGGLEALEAFFRRVPQGCGLGFVVVTHQLPDRTSLLPQLLGRACALPILQVTDPTQVQADHVYLAPPGANLAILQGKLYPEPQGSGPERHHPIDHFLRSLARDQRDRAAGVVLSGTGTDGSAGLKEIKGESGLTLAQDEASARYPGMPRSAVASLLVDYVLPPSEMPARLLAYARGTARRAGGAEGDVEHGETFNRMFLLLRSRTGHDFSHYKGSTIRRRIERRMNIHGIEGAKDYLRYLQTNPGELDQLFKELLIGVTSFFRDPEVWDLLAETVVPDLLRGKPDEHVSRVWVAGCSTGEEAYSLAIVFRECLDRLGLRQGVQIFATDIDPEAIDVARLGVYPDSIAADVHPRRLERYFTRDGDAYKIRQDVREMLVFAQQSVISDPPFTKLDLVSCRNLLIYFDSSLQQRLIPLFHYALRGSGVLLLGTSESLGGAANLFDTIDRKGKIFRRREVLSGTSLAELTSTPSLEPAQREPQAPIIPRKGSELGLVPLAERALLQHLVPPTVLMHESGEIVHIHGRTGAYLEPAPGPQGPANIYNMARPGLELELGLAIRHAAGVHGEVVHRGVRVKTNGDYSLVDLRVKRLEQPEALRGLYVVSFEPSAASDDAAARPQPSEAAERIADLERELQHAKEIHQSTIEELETANEELKSTNEELQSTNEELQSTNEELETSKEEMQSLNEELQTVNAELHGKVEELGRANDDMKNLLNATNIATVFLDNELNIKRYTEQARRVIRLIPSDIGRPISDLVSKIRYGNLVEDAREVLRTLVFKEIEVQSEDGVWYLMRTLPYRTTSNVIDGLVVTFVDVTKGRQLQAQTARILSALRNSPTTVFHQDRELRYEGVYTSLFGRDPERVLGRSDRELFPAPVAERLAVLKRRALDGGAAARGRATIPVDGQERDFDVYIEPVRDEGGVVVGLSGVATEIPREGGDSR